MTAQNETQTQTKTGRHPLSPLWFQQPAQGVCVHQLFQNHVSETESAVLENADTVARGGFVGQFFYFCGAFYGIAPVVAYGGSRNHR